MALGASAQASPAPSSSVQAQAASAGIPAAVAHWQGPKPTIVLVHGAWHGSWCWARVVELLAARGVKAVAPCLAGVGERVKEVSASTTLSTHVDDVVKACAAFSRVTLVGHSYAGLVITPACDELAEKLDALVYLDAFLPANGQSGPRSVSISRFVAVRSPTAVHGRSRTVPWMACGAIVMGSVTSRPSKLNRPSRIRPA